MGVPPPSSTKLIAFCLFGWTPDLCTAVHEVRGVALIIFTSEGRQAPVADLDNRIIGEVLVFERLTEHD